MLVEAAGSSAMPLQIADGWMEHQHHDASQAYAHSPQQQQAPGSSNVSGGPGSPQAFTPSPYMQAGGPHAYWAAAEPMYISLHEVIINQVHYYFSPENLCRDEFLRSQMDPQEGWLPIQLLATFNRLRSISPDPNVIAEVRARDTHACPPASTPHGAPCHQ